MEEEKISKIEIVYNKLASIICFLCQGKCCRKSMTFELDSKTKLVKLKSIDSTYFCISWDKITGRCRSYKKGRPRICEIYKCKTLNLLSRLLGLKMWNIVV